MLGEAWVIEQDELLLASVWNEGPEALDRFARGLTGTTVPLEPACRAASTKEAGLDEGRRIGSALLGAPLARKLGLAAGVAVPVMSGHVVVAVLVFFVTEPREEDEHLIHLVSGVSATWVAPPPQAGGGGSPPQRGAAALDRGHGRRRDRLGRREGTITYVNRAAEEIRLLLHRADGKANQDSDARAFPACSRPRLRTLPRDWGEAHHRKACRAGGPAEGWTKFPVEIALANWSAGGETFFTGVLRDITERRQAEEAMRQSDQLKTALLRSVSHDLRSPLTAIVAAGESSASPNLSADSRREVASVIVNEAARLSRLVDKLLDLSRLQGGAASPRQVACSIEEIIQVALEQTTGEDQFELDVEEPLPGVLADATQLERAFANLFGMPCGSREANRSGSAPRSWTDAWS